MPRRNLKINSQSQLLDIDYDKLAMAIVKAEELSKFNKAEESESHEKLSFWYSLKLLCYLFTKKFETRNTFTYGIFGLFTIMILFSLSIISSIIGVWLLFSAFFNFDIIEILHNLNMFRMPVMRLVIGFLIILVSRIFYLSFKEVDASNDKSFIMTTFNGLISFVALIIALIALLK